MSLTKHNNQRTNLLSRWSGSHVDYVDSGLGETGPSRNGWMEDQMEQNFLVILIFRNIETTSRGTGPIIPKWDSGKFPHHWLPHPDISEFLVEWKAPTVCYEPATDPWLVAMAVIVQTLCTGQRITKEMFTGNAVKLLLFTTTRKMALPFSELKRHKFTL